MADTKLTDLTALTTPSGDDLLYVVDDPAGTPADRKLALDNLFTRGTLNGTLLNMTQTWGGTGTYTGIKYDVTDSGPSNADSLLMDLQVGGASAFNVSKAGSLKLGINSSGTNVAGTNVVIAGSQGTGTGAGGSIIFRVAPAGTTGTAQNALATALTIDSTRLATFAGGVRASNSGIYFENAGTYNLGFVRTNSNLLSFDISGQYLAFGVNRLSMSSGTQLSWTDGAPATGTIDTILARDAANTLAQRNGANNQELRVYGSFTDATNFQRMSIKTLREVSTALSGATYTTTIAIPSYANLIGVTTRVNTAITGATTYDVGDGTDVDLWGAAVAVALGSQSRTANFTAVAAVGAAATSRTVTLTANGSNFTGGVVEICLHYLTTEAD